MVGTILHDLLEVDPDQRSHQSGCLVLGLHRSSREISISLPAPQPVHPSTLWIFFSTPAATSTDYSALPCSARIIVYDRLDHPPSTTSHSQCVPAETACTSLSLFSRTLPRPCEPIEACLFTPPAHSLPISLLAHHLFSDDAATGPSLERKDHLQAPRQDRGLGPRRLLPNCSLVLQNSS
jgi:hypothetical protein